MLRHTTPPCRVRGRTTLVLAMMEDVYTNSYYCRVKDEYTTNHYRLLDIPTTSSSRMQDVHTIGYYWLTSGLSSVWRILLPRQLLVQQILFLIMGT